MGAAIDAIEPGLAVVRDNGTFVALATVLGAVVGLLSLALYIVPLVGPFVSGIVLVPALLATVHGMAFAGHVAGDASPRAGLQSLKSNFLSLAAAYLLRNVLGAVVLLGIVIGAAVVGTFVLGFGMSAASAANPGAVASPLATTGVGGLALAFVVGVLLVSFWVLFVLGFQFLDVAVVVGGESATDALRASWAVFREDPLSVVGYTLLRAAVVGGGIAVCGAVYRVGLFAGVDAAVALLTAALLLAGPFAWAFYSAYHVAYYDARMGNRLGSG